MKRRMKVVTHIEAIVTVEDDTYSEGVTDAIAKARDVMSTTFSDNVEVLEHTSSVSQIEVYIG